MLIKELYMPNLDNIAQKYIADLIWVEITYAQFVIASFKEKKNTDFFKNTGTET